VPRRISESERDSRIKREWSWYSAPTGEPKTVGYMLK
jgi:hypothetical protein